MNYIRFSFVVFLVLSTALLAGCNDDHNNNDGGATDASAVASENANGSGNDASASGNNNDDGNINPRTGEAANPTAPAQLRFLVMGDSGEGGERAFAVGEAMGRVCDAKRGAPGAPERAGCDFVTGLGDNIYESGAASVDDEQFVEKFEQPFAPVKTPFYFVLGNHDNTGYFAGDGADNDHGDVEVDYSYFDGAPTNRWRMPERYYRQDLGKTSDGRPIVSLVGLDSNPIAGGFADADPEFSYSTYGMRQYNWALDALSRSQAVFKVAMAHHPYLSNGEHGNAGSYDQIPGAVLPVLAGQQWKNFMEGAVCDRADFYLNGHDHDMEVLKPVPACGHTRFVLSGAASKVRALADPERNDSAFQQGGKPGFFWMQAMAPNPETGTPAQMCVEAYVVDTDSDDLGVVDNGAAKPSFSHCYAKAEETGMPESTAFKDNASDGQATALPSPDDSFNADYQGALGTWRAKLRDGLSRAIADSPRDAAQHRTMRRMLSAIDRMAASMDGLTSAEMSGQSEDMNQALQSMMAAADQLDAMDTSNLPEPFNRLGGVFRGFKKGLGNASVADRRGGTINDIAFIAGPLVKLARNLDNIVEGAEDASADVPVLMGLTEVLTDVSGGVGQSLAQLAMLETGGTNDALIGSIQQTLDDVVNDVLWLENIDAATKPGDFLSSALDSVTRELTFQLDRATGKTSPLLNILSPITGLISGLLRPA